MISTGQIIAAGVITGFAFAAAARLVNWPRAQLLAASLGAPVLIIVWRLISNALRLNGDYVPAVSIGDTGCLLFGALAPALAAVTRGVPERSRWAPAVVGGIAALVADVFLL